MTLHARARRPRGAPPSGGELFLASLLLLLPSSLSFPRTSGGGWAKFPRELGWRVERDRGGFIVGGARAWDVVVVGRGRRSLLAVRFGIRARGASDGAGGL